MYDNCRTTAAWKLITAAQELPYPRPRLGASLLGGGSKPPLVDEHAFPPTGFAVAWLCCSLHS